MKNGELRNKEKKIFKERLKDSRGITLVALVITIIILLILAGVTISTVTGDNGLFVKTKEAVEQSKKASLIEQVKMDIMEKQLANKSGDIGKEELKEILDIYFKDVPEDYTLETELEAKDEKITDKINVSEIYQGEFKKAQETISKETSYVGYYADLNGDGVIDEENDGIIYADLAVGGSGRWNNDNWSDYAYEAETEVLKEYVVISETSEEDPLNTGNGIVQLAQGNGKDRFYVMALKDFTYTDAENKTHTTFCWYDAAYGKLDNKVEGTANDFGQGVINTAYVIGKWDDESLPYGAHDDNSTYLDLWGAIKPKVNEGWFLPSKSEWSAFGDMMYTKFGMNEGNYADYGLRDWYWSSSERDSSGAYYADFYYGSINHRRVNNGTYVRLSATF